MFVRGLLEIRKARYTGGGYRDEPFDYLLLRPRVTEAGKKYPLILFLHGAGERGTDPSSVAVHFFPVIASDAYRDRFPCFAVGPQCRPDRAWTTAGALGPADDMLKMALQCVEDVVAEFPVDERRLYLTGLSMGGEGSWDLAARQTGRWAAVVPICGGGDPRSAGRLVNVPLWAVHGDADDAVPIEDSRRMIEAVRAAGGDPRFTELPGVGHDSWTPAYADPDGVIPWMFAQRLGSADLFG